VAVCCNPNAGRITPYFVQNSWMKENETTLVATLLMPNILETTINGNTIRIENITQYPHENRLQFKIHQEKKSKFVLKIRKPDWVKKIVTDENYILENDFIIIERTFAQNDEVAIAFEAEVQLKTDDKGERYYTYGALLFAKPIEAREISGKTYVRHFTDFTYQPISTDRFSYQEGLKATFSDGKVITKLINQKTKQLEQVELIPIGKTILRQVTF
jgi:DUF1680 family protein